MGAATAGQLNTAKGRLAKLESQIDAETAALSGLQAQATAVAISIGDVQQRIAQTQGQIAQVRQQMAAALAHQRGVQGQLDGRARAAYEVGPGAPIEFILESASLGDLTDRLVILNSAAQSDAALVAEIERTRQQLASQRSQLMGLEEPDAPERPGRAHDEGPGRPADAATALVGPPRRAEAGEPPQDEAPARACCGSRVALGIAIWSVERACDVPAVGERFPGL